MKRRAVARTNQIRRRKLNQKKDKKLSNNLIKNQRVNKK